MTYSAAGQIATMADGNGNMLIYAYEEFDRPSQLNYPDGSHELTGYDANGNKIGFKTRSTAAITFAYDAQNRLISKAPASEATISYGYDYTGRLLQTQASTDSAPYTYSYDGAGRAISESRPDVGGTVTWTLDANGNRTTLAWPETGALAYSTSYAYDALNRLTDVFEGPASSGVELGHYSYDALSERTGIAYGGTSAAAGGRAPIATTAASYTSAGQVAQLGHSFNSAALTLGYTYNQDHQRSGVSASDASFLVSGLPAASHAYTPNELNQYASVDSQSYGYDTNGNLTGDGVFTYAYDTENQLLSASSSATETTATYAYDPQGRRKSKTVNGTTTNYLSAGNQEIAEYDGSGNLLRRYIYGRGLDEPLATVDAAGNHSFHFTDALGSVLALTNASGQLTEKHAYSAYGLETSSAGTAYQFAGRRIDPETGLYYLRARYYSPSLGRFLQTDPTGTAGGINIYSYVNNDPVNLVDPFGTNPNSTSVLSSIWDAITDHPIASIGVGLAVVGAGACALIEPCGAVVLGALGIGAEGGALAGAGVATDAGVVAEAGDGIAGGLQFSQTTASPWFSAEGDFAGQTISDVASQLRAGTLAVENVPVQYVTTDAANLIVNTRSSLALTQANIPQSAWNLVNMTGNSSLMGDIATRLAGNGLTNAGTSVLRITGSGGTASTYIGSGTIPAPF